MAKGKVDAVLGDILADLAKDGKPSNVQFLKDGDTTLKLVLPKGETDIRKFYTKFQNTFKGEEFTYYLCAAVITDADEDGIADPTRVRYVKITRSIMTEIVNLLQKRWKLFDIAGPLIVITKSKKNGKTTYQIAAIPETFDSANATDPEQTIEEAAFEQEEMSKTFDADKKVEGEKIQ